MTTFPNWEAGTLYLGASDTVMAHLVARYPEQGLTPKADLFRTLIHAIVGQQISVKAAQSVWNRLVTVCGEITPEAIGLRTEEELRSAGLSRMKASYIAGIARDPSRTSMESLRDLSDVEVLKTLTAYRGVGDWTAQMCMIFALCRPDVLPLKDIGLRRAIERLYTQGERMTDEEITQIAEPWRPWRSVATWYLWRSLDPIAVEY